MRSSEYELATENRILYEWIRDNGHAQFVQKASECDMFAYGEQWDPRTKAKLSRRKKPALTINRVLPAVSTLQGEYLNRRGDIAFRAAAGGDPTTAQALDKLWIHFCQTNNYDWNEFSQFTDGVVRSRGFLDLRISFDDSMRGEPTLTYLNSKDVGLLPGDYGMDPDKWSGVLLTKWLSPRDISEVYGVPIDDVMNFADAPEISADYADWRKDSFGSPLYDHQIISPDQRRKFRLLRVLERQEWEYKTVECFVDQETGDVREVPVTWDRDRIVETINQYGYAVIRRRAKKINWVVSVGTMLLHNAISPFKHFTPVPYFPFLIGGRPVGIVEQLRDPQNLLNKTLSQELHIVAGIANSGFKVKAGALHNMSPTQLEERGGEDGIVIEVTGPLSDVEKLQPNQVPTGLDRLSYKAGEAMSQISLVNESMMGQNRADEAGKAVLSKAQQGSSALAPIYASLDQSRRIMARNWLDLVQEFVTEPRVYHITTSKRNQSAAQQQPPVEVNQPQPDGSFLNDLTVGEYMVNVTNVAHRDAYDMNQFDIMMQMVRQGAPIPWSSVINTLTILDDKDQIVEFLRGQEGQTDPSEEQRAQAAAQQRLLNAQALDKESSAQVKVAQAQKVSMEAQGGDGQAEMMKMQQQSAMKQQELQQQSIMKQQELQFTLGAKEREMALKEQEAQTKNDLLLQKAQIDARIAEERLESERRKRAMEEEFLRRKQELEILKIERTMEASAMAAQAGLEQKRMDGALSHAQRVQEAEFKQKQQKIAQQEQASNESKSE